MLLAILDDVREGIRATLRRPFAPSMAALTLALGLGGGVAVFAVMDAALLRPLFARDPKQIVAIHGFDYRGGDFLDLSYPDYQDLSGETGTFTSVLAYFRVPLSVVTGGRAKRLSCELVSSNYFDGLGVGLAAGRTFLPNEGTPPDRTPVAVISDALSREIGGFATVGGVLRINGKAFDVVGVAPPGFRGIALDRGEPPALWIPLGSLPDALPSWQGTFERRDSRWLRVVGRLKAEVAVLQAGAAVRLLAQRLQTAYPKTNHDVGMLVTPGAEARVSPRLRQSVVSFTGIMAGVMAFLLLVVSSNVGHLLLLQAWRRSREFAVRGALGAEPVRLARQVLVEASLVACAGWIGSLAVAKLLLSGLLKGAWPSGGQLSIDGLIDARVVAFSVAASLIMHICFGLVPSLLVGRTGWQAALYSGQRGAPAPPGLGAGLSGVLLGGQVALSLILLVGGSVFRRTVAESLALDPGFAHRDVALFSVDLGSVPGRYAESTGLTFYREAIARVQGVPGVNGATWSAAVPLGSRILVAWWRPVQDQGEASTDTWNQTDCDIVATRYFETLGIRLVKGREFHEDDNETAPGVAVISGAMARRYFPNRDPVGQHIRVRGRAREAFEIVGVAEDVKRRSLWEDARPFLYLPLAQRYFPEMTLYVRGDSHEGGWIGPTREVLASLDSDVPVFGVRTIRDLFSSAVSEQRLGAAVLGGAGVLAALVAAFGLYAITRYVATQRRYELAIRMAMGAEGKDLLWLLLTRCGLPMALGLGSGTAMAIWLSRFVKGFVFGVSPLDPLSFVTGGLALAGTGLVAVYLPASRAARADPLTTLRAE